MAAPPRLPLLEIYQMSDSVLLNSETVYGRRDFVRLAGGATLGVGLAAFGVRAAFAREIEAGDDRGGGRDDDRAGDDKGTHNEVEKPEVHHRKRRRNKAKTHK
jgi:hypothetical protein